MPMTEDELRTALRGIPATLPPAPDRMGGIEHRVRRHRRRVVASVAAAVAVVLLAVPVVRLVSDGRQRDAQPVGTQEQRVRDAMMQYATFVALWDGKPYVGGEVTDPGVEGVVVTTSLPPTTCTIASSAPGEPSGTQQAWVLGTGSVVPSGDRPVVLASIAVLRFLWPVGVSACDPRPGSGETMAETPPAVDTPVAAEVAGVQALSDPTRPALDVAAVYRLIPDDRLTQHGRDVFASYQAWRDRVDFGTPTEQNERVLHALLDWLGVAMVSALLTPSSPQSGPVLLRSTDYVGTAMLPEGYAARWDGKTLCIDGSVNGSPVQHASNDSYVEPGGTFTALDGPCP